MAAWGKYADFHPTRNDADHEHNELGEAYVAAREYVDRLASRLALTR